MGFFDDNTDVIGEPIDDFVQTTTGSCDTPGGCGWFGAIDRAGDPRSVEDDEWQEGTDPRGNGLSGALDAFTGAATGATNQVGEATTRPLLGALGLDDGMPDGEDENNGPTPEERKRQQMILLGLALALGVGVVVVA